MLVSLEAQSTVTLETRHRKQRWRGACCWKRFPRCNILIQVVYLFCIILFCFRPTPPLVWLLALFCWLRIFVNSKFSISALLSCPAFLLIAYFVIRFLAGLCFLFGPLLKWDSQADLDLVPPRLLLCRPVRSLVWTSGGRRRSRRGFHRPYLDI